jgi:hypothetical protein
MSSLDSTMSSSIILLHRPSTKPSKACRALLCRLFPLLHLGQIPTARSTQLPLSIVGRPTNLGPPQTSFHMTSFFRRRFKRGNTDVSNVARPTFQTWQVRRFKRGKTDVSNVASETFQTWQDVSNVASETFQTWQDRRCKRGKTDVSNVARPTFQTWQDRRFKRGK